MNISQQSSGPSTIVYCRVSTKGQRHRTRSLEAQAELGCRWAEAQGYTVGRVTQEVHSGSELWDRPLFARDRADLQAGRFQALIVTDLDRLSRNPVHLALIAEGSRRAGGTLAVVNGPLPGVNELLSPGGPGVRAWLEREQLRARMVAAKRSRALAGLIHGTGCELYGYRRDKDAGIRVVYEPEAVVVRQIFQWVVVERVTLGEVRRRLRAQAVPPPSVGKIDYGDPERTPRWGGGTLHRILCEPSYMGTALAWRWQESPSGGMPIERPDEERIVLPDHVTPALVAAEVWQAAQEIIVANQRTAAQHRQRARRYLLRGLIHCAVCGRRLNPDPHSEGIFYRCSSRTTAAGKCGASLVHQAKCEAWVWEQVAALLTESGPLIAELREAAVHVDSPVLACDRAILDHYLGATAGRIGQLTNRLATIADDALEHELIERELAQVEQVRQYLESTADELDHQLNRERAPAAAVGQVLALLEQKASLATCSFEEQRLVLEVLGVRVVASGREWSLLRRSAGGEQVVAETM